MKHQSFRTLLVLALCSLSVAVCTPASAAQRGKFIHVDNTVNKSLKPQLAFCQDHKDGQDITTLLVKTVNTNAYNEFTDASRILIRFADGEAVRLNKIPGSEVKKDKNNEKVGKATITKYWTEVAYEVTPAVTERLEKGIAIIKVRVVFKENDAKDYEIAEGYQPKMAEDLLKSYQEASLNNQKSNKDLSDDDF